MTLDNARTASNPRKKAAAGIIILIVILFVWQISSMFGKATHSRTDAVGGAGVASAQTKSGSPPPPKTTAVPQTTPITDRESALMTLQQETQVKYLEALNELQLLKVAKDIAVTNKDISAAKLDRVSAEKKIVDLLGLASAPPPAATTVTTTQAQTVAPIGQDVTYNVVSVSQLQYRWGAVLSYRGALYNVHVGDILPPDGSMVVAIGKDSVTLQKDGVRKKVSLVSII